MWLDYHTAGRHGRKGRAGGVYRFTASGVTEDRAYRYQQRVKHVSRRWRESAKLPARRAGTPAR
jgi:hypothetical protein